MKTYKQRTDSILKKVQTIKQKRRKTVWISVVSSLCGVFILANAILFLPQMFLSDKAAGGNMMEAMPESSTTHVTSDCEWGEESFDPTYQKVVSQIKSILSDEENSDQIEDPTSAQEPSDNDSTPENNYQDITDDATNGIAEGDLFLRAKTHIFYLNKAKNVRQLHEILVYSIEGESSQKVSAYTIEKDVYQGEEYSFIGMPRLYLSEDNKTLTVVAPCKVSGDSVRYYTAIISLDVSDPTAITENNRTYLSGSYQASRMVDGTLFIGSRFSVEKTPDFSDERTFLPQYGSLQNRCSVQASDILYPEDEAKYAIYTTLCKIDEKTLQEQGFIAMFSMYTDMVVSEKNVFLCELTSGFWGEESAKKTLTRIHYVAQENGLEYKGFFDVLGVLKNSSIEEKDGLLHVVTENTRTRTENRYEIRLSDFEIIAKKEELAVNAQIEKLTEFYNGTLLGVGGDWRYGLKLEVFTPTETGVESVAVYELDCSFSEDTKTYFIDKERGLFGLSVTMMSEDNGIQISYLLLQFDGSNWRKLQVKTPCDSESDTRAILIDGYLYIFSCETFYVVSV